MIASLGDINLTRYRILSKKKECRNNSFLLLVGNNAVIKKRLTGWPILVRGFKRYYFQKKLDI
jgi:hypothetical protein